jgi:molybdopterin/thiamine biosynthesis adenylyltransferase/rhodanese-related sulfurtransferase
MDEVALTSEEQERYSRHLVLPEVGVDGQAKLKSAGVLIVGAGGLGSPVGLYLAAAGVGLIGIADDDSVTLSNLQRQVLYSTGDVGKSKARLARDRLLSLNPNVDVIVHADRVDTSNILDVLKGYDIVADCTDNFPSRYLLNDACVLAGKVCVYGSVFRFEGQVSVWGYHGGPCYRCLYPVPPPPELAQDCSQSGVIGSLPGLIGAMQACEIIKLIIGKGKPLSGRMFMFDGLAARPKEIAVGKDPACPLCGEHPTITSLMDYEEFCSGEKSTEASGSNIDITVEELKRRLDCGESLQLLDVREHFERDICNLGGTFIPLGELQQRMSELDQTQELIVYCHHGIRSQSAVNLLRHSGVRKARNLLGGIDMWAQKVDVSMRRY